MFVWNSFTQEILTDRSHDKTTSHERLLHFIEKYYDPSFLARVYLKGELELLCEAYEVRFRQSEMKNVLAMKLIEVKRRMPFIARVDDRQFQVVESVADEYLGRVRISFRLSGKYLLTMPLFKRMFQDPE